LRILGVLFLPLMVSCASTDKMSQRLPGPIRATLQREFPGAEILEVELEHWRGQEVYEVEFIQGGMEIEAYFSPGGELLDVEEHSRGALAIRPFQGGMPEKDVRIPMRDGNYLVADVFRPKGPNPCPDEDSWPLRDTSWTPYDLDAVGYTLADHPPEQQGHVSWEGSARKGEQSCVCFATPPFPQAVEVTGPLAANLWVSPDQEDFDIFVAVRNLRPDGTEVLMPGEEGVGPVTLGDILHRHPLDTGRHRIYTGGQHDSHLLLPIVKER